MLLWIVISFFALNGAVQAQIRYNQKSEEQVEQDYRTFFEKKLNRIELLRRINRLVLVEDSVLDASGKYGHVLFYSVLSRSYLAAGRVEEAIRYGMRGLSIAEQLNANRLIFQLASTLVKAYKTQGLVDQTSYYLSVAIAAADASRDKSLQNAVTLEEAQFYFDRGAYDKVDELLRGYRLTLVSDKEDSLFRANVLLEHWLARDALLRSAGGENSLSISDLETALTYLGDFSGREVDALRVKIIGTMGNVARANGNLAKAVNHYQAILSWAERMNNLEEMMAASTSLARTFALQGSVAKAEDFFRKGLILADSLRRSDWQELILMDLYRLAYRDARPYDALRYLEKAKRVADSTYSQKVAEQSIEAQALFDLDRKQTQIQVLVESNRRQSLFQYALVAGILLLVVIVVLVMRLNIQHRRTNTLLERKNEEIARQKNKLEELNETKNRLFSIIGHDLRGPVGNIRTFLEMLEGAGADLTPKEYHDIIENAKRSATATFTLLNTLLDWAKHQMGEVRIENEPIQLQASVREAELFLSGAIKKKNIRVSVQLDPVSTVIADRNLLATVIRNLLSNAIKFTREGGRIHISSIHKPGSVVLSISDNGIGIPPEIKQKIFSDKVVSRTGTDRETGSGLGLFLCKTLIEDLGGKIWLESEVNIGTTVFIELKEASEQGETTTA